MKSKSPVPIEKIIRQLRKAIKTLPLPIVTQISQKHRDPFLVLISCILSLRTKDAVTRQASFRLFKLADNPQAMLKLSTKKIEKTIYPVGFFRVKAKNILSICQDLIDKFRSRVPDDLEELLTLKGVGRKTANLVLTEGFHKLGICVDTHVHRVSNRLGYVKTRNPFETEMALRKKLPKRFWIEYNNLLVTWGQNICKPVSPLCSICTINKYCRKIGVTLHR
jgi:endonuclease-3